VGPEAETGRSGAITERIHEAIVVRARGGMLSFPCPERQYDFGKGWSADTDFFPYLPINHNGTFQFVVDRARCASN
jgi:hypothetical protein